MATRRQVLKAFGAAATALLPGCGGGGDSSGSDSGGESAATGAPFGRPLAVPPVLAPTSSDAAADYYDLHVAEAVAEIFPGQSTRVITFNGMSPGPTIRARAGRRSVISVHNGLPETTLGAAPGTTVIHLHGGHTPAADDGFPTDYINPGASRIYTYPNDQLPATLWYHDHTMDFTGPHVWFGMAGFYLLSDDFEDSLNLPAAAYEIPLVIQDRQFDSDGALRYTYNRNGETGATILVNGVVQPYFEIAQRKYRFRVLNGSNARFYRLALGNGQSFAVLGMEGGLLPAPVQVSSITLAPAERADIVMDFSALALSSNVTLNNTLVSGASTAYNVMRFDVTSTANDTSELPSTLRPLTRLDPAAATVQRDFTLSGGMGMMGGGTWTINGAAFDPNSVMAQPRLGAVEIWRFTNNGMMMGMDHPIHIHGAMFQILDINGASPPATHAGWKDTVVVPAGGSARLMVQFRDYTGKYVMHCHILEHEDRAMMARFDVVP
jgi:spore coat protein A, manganese oxidase